MMRAIVMAAAIALASCSSPAPEQSVSDDGAAAIDPMTAPVPSPAPPTVDPLAIDAAKAALLAEPKVKDVRYSDTDTVQWHIGVIDDGTERVGYAEYVCSILADKGATTGRTHVRVVDVERVAAGADLRAASLGHVICETGDIVAP